MNRTKELKELAEHMRETATWLRYYGGFNRKEQNLAAMIEGVAQSIENDFPKKFEFTDWFPGRIKPARVGVYQQLSGDDVGYQYWDGKKWGAWDESAKTAFQLRHNYAADSYQNDKWRGLTHEAK